MGVGSRRVISKESCKRRARILDTIMTRIILEVISKLRILIKSLQMIVKLTIPLKTIRKQ